MEQGRPAKTLLGLDLRLCWQGKAPRKVFWLALAAQHSWQWSRFGGKVFAFDLGERSGDAAFEFLDRLDFGRENSLWD